MTDLQYAIQVKEKIVQMGLSVFPSTIDKMDKLAGQFGMTRSEYIRALINREYHQTFDNQKSGRPPKQQVG